VYAVARGIATFFDGSTRRRVEPGALIFVPAGQEHRFEQFSSDFAVWVLFCDAITPGTRTAGPRRDTSR
jgi:mannose-6-phosphate isomerase-like protein (cupin superfamily)